MLKSLCIIVVAVFAVSVASAAPVGTSSTENQLTNTEPMMKGHVVALFMSHLIVSLSPVLNWDAPVLVSFSEAEGCIELEILGGRDSIDGAKQSTDGFRQQLLAAALAALNEHFGLSLEEKDLIITYIYKSNWTKILTLRNSMYSIE